MAKHKNSIQVVIKRVNSINHSNTKAAEEYSKSASVSIGSYFNKSKTGTGLDTTETDLLMPILIDYESTDRQFRKHVTKYFDSINTKIPYDGLTLEIGLKEDNQKPVSSSNMPIDVEDYVKYHHAKGHPFMASSEEEARGTHSKQYYIEDSKELKKKRSEEIKLKDEAIAKYLEIKSDSKLQSQVLIALGIELKDKEGNPIDKLDVLRSKSEEDPSTFLEIANNPNLKYIAFINDLVTYKVVRKEGNRYLFEGSQLGASQVDFIEYLKDEANSDTLTILKAKLSSEK